MISNNTEALKAVAELSKSDIVGMLRKVNLMTAGTAPVPAADVLLPAGQVTAALENADCDGGLATLAVENPDGIVAGIKAACKVAGAVKALAVFPEKYADGQKYLTESAANSGLDLTVEISDMVNARAHKDDVLLSFVTLASIADVLTGKKPAAMLVIDGKLCEAKFGEPLRKIIPADGAKAVFINHCFFPAEVLDEPLQSTFPLGSGKVETVGKNDCIVRKTVEGLNELRAKSCGKCTFCREGLYQLSAVFEDITLARSKPSEIDLANEIGEAMEDSVMCSLGRTAANPALSSLKSFNSEVEAHVKKKTCLAGTCKAFMSLYIDPSKCAGNGDCIDACPEDCIEGKDGYISMIDEFSCTKCGKCVSACTEGAVRYASGRMPALPKRLTRVGRFRRH